MTDMTDVVLALGKVTDRAPEEALKAVGALYPQTPTVLDAVKAAASAETSVLYEKGCDINDTSAAGIAEAVVDVARQADVAILVLGDKTGWVFDATSGEGRDHASLELPGASQRC